LNVDIVPPDAHLAGYAMVVVPTLPILSEAQADVFAALNVPVLFGPRTGSKTADFQIPDALPPGPLQKHVPIRVTRASSARGDPRWQEGVETTAAFVEGSVYRKKHLRYLSVWPDADQFAALFSEMAGEAGLAITPLPADLRIRHVGDLCFAFNYGPGRIDLATTISDAATLNYLVGSADLPSAGVAVWRVVQ
jgi:beta-galactosidase